MAAFTIQRLTPGKEQLAGMTFAAMAEAFEEESEPTSAEYVARLLRRPDFWAFAAVSDDKVVGGITAFTLPLTRAERQELFLYDIAVLASHRRQGVGRALVAALRQAAAREAIGVTFVLADNEDTHALDFYRALGAESAPVTAFTFADS